MSLNCSFIRALRYFTITQLSKNGYRAFISRLLPGARVLDVGCGNNSPFKLKSQRPDIHYTGLDVGDYNQTSPNLADKYIVVPPAEFVFAIQKFEGEFDAVISSHNIEHCQEPEMVIRAIVAALRQGGCLYLSFPSEQSLSFPSRRGCLNFKDDPTHHDVPQFLAIKQALLAADCEIIVAHQQYQPAMLWLIGALQEPWSRLKGRTLFGTWAFFGFESVIWARKRNIHDVK